MYYAMSYYDCYDYYQSCYAWQSRPAGKDEYKPFTILILRQLLLYYNNCNSYT